MLLAAAVWCSDGKAVDVQMNEQFSSSLSVTLSVSSVAKQEEKLNVREISSDNPNAICRTGFVNNPSHSKAKAHGIRQSQIITFDTVAAVAAVHPHSHQLNK